MPRYSLLAWFLAVMLVGAVRAGADELTTPLSDCDVREDYSLCVVKKQRDDALDREAVARGELARTRSWWKSYTEGAASNAEITIRGEAKMVERRDVLAAWWKSYVDGLDVIQELDQ
jgi:hypothetical protein